MFDAITRLVRFLVVDQWPLTLPLVLGGVALYFLLPRPQGRQLLYGAVLGVVALGLAGLLIVNVGGVSVETVLFYTFSVLAVVAGTLLVAQHNPARAALSFALVILSVSGLFVLLAAPFLMAATITIYAGAIVVTFLFVLMLAQQSGLSDADIRSREPLLASLTGVVLLGALLYVLQLAFRQGTHELDPFLNRIRDAHAQATAEGMDEALKRDPDELNRAVERLWRINSNTKSHAELVKVLTDKNAEFSTRLYQALDMLGQADLRNRLEDEPTRFNFPGKDAPDAAEKMKAVLKNYEVLVLQARQRVGLFQADAEDERYQSGFSGPPAALTPRLRRDDFGRPQSPAENSAHLGRSLFTDYLLPVELGGFLLLVAVIGSIAIAHRQATHSTVPVPAPDPEAASGTGRGTGTGGETGRAP
jgi:NADH:ubiquinone oxidoreductase subunit 6 (subunit J)